VAASIGADGVVARLRSRSFGWRQPAALALAVLTGLLPLAGASWWVARGAADPVQARDPVQVPAYIATAMHTPAGARTLVVRPAGPDGATYTYLRHDRYSFADLAVAPERRDSAVVDDSVRALMVEQNLVAVRMLARLGVRYVYLTDASGVGSHIVEDLDAIPGLARASAPAHAAVWQLTDKAGPIGPMTVVESGAAHVSGGGAAVLTADPRDAHVRLAAGPSSRRLQLAEAAAPGWRAELDGVRLQPVHDNGLAAFALPARGGQLHVWFDAPAQTRWRWAQLGMFIVLVALAFPGVARDAEAAARTTRRRTP
jgi:hypothetical protein